MAFTVAVAFEQFCKSLRFSDDELSKISTRYHYVHLCLKGTLTVQNQRFEEMEKEVRRQKQDMAQVEKRIAELDRIFKRIYEDDISGTISHERFLKLSAEYETEQQRTDRKGQGLARSGDYIRAGQGRLSKFCGRCAEVCGHHGADINHRQRVRK